MSSTTADTLGLSRAILCNGKSLNYNCNPSTVNNRKQAHGETVLLDFSLRNKSAFFCLRPNRNG